MRPMLKSQHYNSQSLQSSVYTDFTTLLYGLRGW